MFTRIGSGAVVLALGLALAGCGATDAPVSSNDDASAGSTSAAPEPSAVSVPSASPSPSANGTCDTDCTFGQTAIYEDSVDAGDMQLEITVLAPIEFTPSAGAQFLTSFANATGAKPMNVYFPVTIKNVSPSLPRTDDFVFMHATNAKEGETDAVSVSDGDVTSYVQFDDLAPGQSVTIKSGWSMSTLDRVKFKVSIDGLDGHSIEFEPEQ